MSNVGSSPEGQLPPQEVVISPEASSSSGLGFLRERGKDYLHRQPDDPDDIRLTREFCQEGIDLLRHTYAILIQDAWGETRSEEFGNKFASVADTSNVESDLQPSNKMERGVFLRTPIMKNAITVDPRLLSAEIDSALSFNNKPQDEFEADIYKRTTKPLSRSSLRELTGTRQRLSSRYSFIDKTGLFEADPRIKKYLSVLYVIQAAKNNAVEEAKHIVDIKVVTRPSVKVVPPENTDQNIRNLRPNTDYIRRQLRYAFIGASSLRRFAEQVGFSSKQEELLNDLAFMNKGDLPSGEFTRMLQPLADCLKKGTWEVAFVQRDFLIKYFPHMFPEWKVAEARETTFRSINDLVRNGQTLLDVTPPGYSDIVKSKLAEIEDREKKRQEPKERRQFGEQVLLEAMKKVSQQYKEGFDNSKPISEYNPMPLPIGYQRLGKISDNLASVVKTTRGHDGSMVIWFRAGNAKTATGRLMLYNVVGQLIDSQALTGEILNQVFETMRDNVPQIVQNMSLKEILSYTLSESAISSLFDPRNE